MATTIRDVASLAGVSIKTVSNVVNERPYITPETQKKVLAAIAALDYKPNRSAQALRTRKAQALAVIIPDIQNTFFTSVVRGIEDRAYEAGYMLLLANTEDDPEREKRYIQMLSVGTVSGIVLCAADERKMDSQIEMLCKADVALVAIDRTSEPVSIDAVLADNVQGSFTAVQHLLALGHRRIGIIAGPDYFAPGRERLAGYLRALSSFGIEPDEALIRRTDFKADSSRQATQGLLQLASPPTALFVCTGRMALGAIEVIRESRLRMPNDIAVITFDDPDWRNVVEAPLSVVAQPGYEMGRVAAELLLQRLQQPDSPLQEIRLPTTFIHRKSCCLSLSAD